VALQDNLYSRELSLFHIHRLYLGCQLPDRVTVTLREAPRLVYRFNTLAEHAGRLVSQSMCHLSEAGGFANESTVDATEPGETHSDDDRDVVEELDIHDNVEGEYDEYDDHVEAEGEGRGEGGVAGDGSAVVEGQEEGDGDDGDFEAFGHGEDAAEPADFQDYAGQDVVTEEALDLANVGEDDIHAAVEEGADESVGASGSIVAVAIPETVATVESVDDEALATIDDVADAVDVAALPYEVPDEAAPLTQTEHTEGKS
jgi:hypothetical protein